MNGSIIQYLIYELEEDVASGVEGVDGDEESLGGALGLGGV
jgi:hypothetical protein